MPISNALPAAGARPRPARGPTRGWRAASRRWPAPRRCTTWTRARRKLDWADATIYQMAEIALHTIDQVTIAMDFDTGAGHDQVIDRLLPFIAAQAPARTPDEHDRVAKLGPGQPDQRRHRRPRLPRASTARSGRGGYQRRRLRLQAARRAGRARTARSTCAPPTRRSTSWSAPWTPTSSRRRSPPRSSSRT